MCWEYYQITERENPDKNGAIIRVKDSKLETFAGSLLMFDELDLRINQDDSVEVNKNFYRIQELSEQEAIQYKRTFDSFQKNFIGSFSQIGIA